MLQTARWLVLAPIVLGGITSHALADTGWNPALDEIILINGGESFTLTPNNNTITFSVMIAPNPNKIIGFSFAGYVSGISGTSTWASDTRLDISDENGHLYDIGGSSSNLWDFNGPQSTQDGAYSHGWGSPFGDGNPALVFDKIAKGGVWTFTFTQSAFFGVNEVTWKGVAISLHKQLPTPAAIALFGLAGIFGPSRRRR